MLRWLYYGKDQNYTTQFYGNFMGDRLAIYPWTVTSNILEGSISIDSLAILSWYCTQWIDTLAISQSGNVIRVTE